MPPYKGLCERSVVTSGRGAWQPEYTSDEAVRQAIRDIINCVPSGANKNTKGIK